MGKQAASGYLQYTKLKVKYGLWKTLIKLTLLGGVIGYGYYKFTELKDHSS